MAALHPPSDLSSLKDKSVFITGGASGLGLAVATKFASEGAYVTIADVNDKLGHDAVKALSDKVSYVHCDVTNWESSIAGFKHAINFSPHKTLDIVFLSAGIVGDGKSLVDSLVEKEGEPSLDHDPNPPYIHPITVNFLGVYNTTYLAMYYMRLKGTSHSTSTSTNGHTSTASTTSTPKKSLILISSLAGYVDYGNTPYNAAKFGVRGLFRSIRSKTPSLDLRCNLIAPWFIDTPMTGPIKERLKSAGLEQGKGFTFAPIENLVDAVGLCAVDDRVDGRAFAIMPEGFFDLEEDMEKGYGGPKLFELISKRREAGDATV